MVYLDNAATSFPKPPQTIDQLTRFVTEVGGNPGRSGHPLSIEAARIVFQTREKLAAFINIPDSERLVFTLNGTDSLNLAILGLLRPGDHVVTTSMEHNSVMRPLDHLRKRHAIKVTTVRCSPAGDLDPDDVRRALTPLTRLVVVNHGSNVTGTVQPLGPIREAIGDVPLVVDACQTVGNIPIDVQASGMDAICFSCHKSLLGIQGLGAAYFRRGIDPEPTRFGGTGSRSESTEQPLFMPDRCESGTPASPAIAALLGGLTFLEETGLDEVREKKRFLKTILLDRLAALPRVTVYGNPASPGNLPIVALNLGDASPSEVGYACNKSGICVRVGLHCAPVAHQTIGTFPQGAVRVSPGYFNNEEHIELFVEVLRGLVRR